MQSSSAAWRYFVSTGARLNALSPGATEIGTAGCSKSAAKAAGYAEYALPSTREFADLIRWASVFTRLRGMPVTEAIRYAQKQQQWGSARMQLAVSALADLEANLQQHITRMRLGSLPLERSFLMDCSEAYYSF
ncbi:hypothetical protein [Paenibacillus sp. JZ16]|uniref:hypothetical protein n=1 Tax=Paenibacillus sp. JZ16 TaxID=1906272 RepID=UPI001F15DB72|nr:hypothetical protein [Paenibacillus sp. JZ16]